MTAPAPSGSPADDSSRGAPSVVGRPLEEAQRILLAAGVAVAGLQETRSPRGGPTGPLRVIRQRERAARVELTAAASVSLIARGADPEQGN